MLTGYSMLLAGVFGEKFLDKLTGIANASNLVHLMDSKSVIDHCKDEYPHIIFIGEKIIGLDIQMVIKELAVINRTSYINPIILVLKEVDEQFLMQCLALGINNYVLESASEVELNIKLRQIGDVFKKIKQLTEDCKLANGKLECVHKEYEAAQESFYHNYMIKQDVSENINVSITLADQVGGDFFKVFKTSDYIQYIVLGDFTGHGLSAAMYLNAAINALQETIIDDVPFENVIDDLNNKLFQYLDVAHFLACVILKIDYKENHLKLWNATMPQVYLLNKENENVKAYKSISYPLGASEIIITEHVDIYFNKGDRLFVYTDGVTECKNWDEEEYGNEQLESLLLQNNNAGNLTNVVKEDLKRFRKGLPQDDDISMIDIMF